MTHFAIQEQLKGNVVDLAVGATHDDDGGANQGAAWILSLNSDGTVASERKISETAGGCTGDLDPTDWFGSSVAALGELDRAGAVAAVRQTRGPSWSAGSIGAQRT